VASYQQFPPRPEAEILFNRAGHGEAEDSSILAATSSLATLATKVRYFDSVGYDREGTCWVAIGACQ
jgi:hypothetical protein